MRSSIERGNTDMHETDRYLTVPNALTMLRFLIAGYFVIALCTWDQLTMRDWLTWATTWAAVAFTSDFVDGQIARRWPNQASKFGAKLDPVADKAAVLAFLGYLFAANVMTFGVNAETVFVTLILLREVGVSYLRWRHGHDSLPVVRGGKWKTALQMAALLAYGLLPALPQWSIQVLRTAGFELHVGDLAFWFWAAALSLLAVATYQTVTTGVRYVRPFLGTVSS